MFRIIANYVAGVIYLIGIIMGVMGVSPFVQVTPNQIALLCGTGLFLLQTGTIVTELRLIRGHL